jgi:hypothetical protein
VAAAAAVAAGGVPACMFGSWFCSSKPYLCCVQLQQLLALLYACKVYHIAAPEAFRCLDFFDLQLSGASKPLASAAEISAVRFGIALQPFLRCSSKVLQSVWKCNRYIIVLIIVWLLLSQICLARAAA